MQLDAKVVLPVFNDAWRALAQPARLAPVQGYDAGIPWSLHLEAYAEYCKRYSPQPRLIQGNCRGGFDVSELDSFIPGWRERVSTEASKKMPPGAEARVRTAFLDFVEAASVVPSTAMATAFIRATLPLLAGGAVSSET
jgi:hypothetical protein